MNEEELVQKIGNEVCDDCGPDADCGEDPAECVRVATAIGLLGDYIKGLPSQQAGEADTQYYALKCIHCGKKYPDHHKNCAVLSYDPA